MLEDGVAAQQDKPRGCASEPSATYSPSTTRGNNGGPTTTLARAPGANRPPPTRGGVPASRIQQTQDAAKLTLLAAARTDAERQFCDGYTDAVDARIATLRAAQRAEPEAGQRERAADREREAG